MVRPYSDYVRASDVIQVAVDINGNLLNLHPLDVLASYSDFPDQQFFSALQSRKLFLNNFDSSQWSPWYGGTVVVTVGPTVDFAHLADVGGAVAQSLVQVGYSPSSPRALFIAQVSDDITPDEQQRFSDAANRVGGPQSLYDFPGNLWTGVSNDLERYVIPSIPWVLIGGIGLLAVMMLSGRKGRK